MRNNVIYASMPHDSVVEMVHASGWLVANNTALLLDPAPGLTWGMEARFSDTSGTFTYNLLNLDVINRDGANGTMTGNVTSADTTWFVDADSGDLHLLSSAAGAVDQAAVLTEVTDDIDGHPRPIGVAPDVGADEVLVPPSLVLTPTAYLPLVVAGTESGRQIEANPLILDLGYRDRILPGIKPIEGR